MSRVSDYFDKASKQPNICDCGEYCNEEAVIVVKLRTPMDIPELFPLSDGFGLYCCEKHREEGEMLIKANPLKYESRRVNSGEVPLKSTGPKIKCKCGVEFRLTMPKDYEKSGFKSYAQNMNRFPNQIRQDYCDKCGIGHQWSLSSFN